MRSYSCKGFTAGYRMSPTSVQKAILLFGGFEFLHHTCVKCIMDNDCPQSSCDTNLYRYLGQLLQHG